MSRNEKLATSYTIVFLASAFLGDKILAIDMGFLLSPYRILLILFPFTLFFFGSGNPFSIKRKDSPSFEYTVFLRFWLFYSLLQFPFCKDYSNFGYYFLFLASAYIMAWLVYRYINTKESLYNIFSVFEYIALLLTLVGIYEILTGDYKYVDFLNASYYDINSALDSSLGIRVPISVFGNPNDFGLFLLFAVCVSNAMRHIRKRKIGRLMSTALQALFTVMVFTTLSRAAAISLLIVYGYIVLSSYKRYTFLKKIVLFAVVLLSSSSIITWIVANKDIVDSFLSVDIHASSGSDFVRINLIKNGLVFLKDSLFLGVGIGNIEYYMQHYPVYNTEHFLNIHNWWIEVLVSSGIIVFIWYIKIYIKKLLSSYRFVKLNKNTNDLYYFHISVVAMLLAFVIGSISSSSIFVTGWMWAMFAVIFAIPSNFSSND